MEIYAEALFLINFSALFISLAPSVKLFGISRQRHIISAVIGGILAVMAFSQTGFNLFPALNSLIVAAITFKKNSKAYIMFFATQLIMYAVILTVLSVYSGGTGIIIQNGILYINISLYAFILSFLLAYPCVSIMIRVCHSQSKNNIHRLKITKNRKTINVKALFDSGNLLTEPRSGKNVILVSRKALSELNPDNILTNELPLIIPYRSVGHSGVITGFNADKIIIDNKKEINDAVIGISEQEFSADCEALIGGI